MWTGATDNIFGTMWNLRALVLLVWTLVWATIGTISTVVDPTGRFYMYLARAGWARQILWLGGVDLTVKGGDRVDWARPYVVCSNHVSALDIPVAFAGLPMPVRFLAKRSLFFIPVFGWSLFMARFIPVARGNRDKARRSVDRGALRIRKGPSLMVFPEGTRSADGRLRPFKSGAFVMAIRAGVPLLPVAIRGTFDVVPKSRLAVHPGPVELVVGTPIPTTELEIDDKDDLKRLVHRAVEEMLESGEPARIGDARVASV